ncbi:MAG: hypothetical protein Q9195_001204 [Heterodermia aff. obscurata]
MSISRFSLDAQSLSGSLHSQSERPGSFVQGLRAKGSRLMRRQNSKFNSRSMDWQEVSEDRLERAGEQELWGVGSTKHSRIASAGDSFIDKREISEPYNFQHLTHTHARHFREIERASNRDLVSEFSAIRASQMPRRELKGIKTNCLPSKVSQSEPVSPIRNSPSTSPTRSAYYDNAGNLSANRLDSNAPNYSQSLSRSHKAHHLPGLPPARSSSRAAVTTAPDFFTAYHEDQAEEYSPSSSAGVPFATSGRSGSCSSQPLVLENNNGFQDFDFSALPHAVTTPDDSAFPLTPTKLRSPGAELADVPEEDERISVVYSPPSTPRSGLRHAMSFPSTKSNSQRWSCSPRKASVRDSIPVPLPLNQIRQSETMLPLVGEEFDDIPVRPRFSRRISLKPQGFDTCWEDDIDYCYDHAAEADCDFDWDKISTRVDDMIDAFETDGNSKQVRDRSISDRYEDIRSPSSSSMAQVTVQSSLPRLQTLLPEPAPLSSSNSVKSSSIASLATPATPQFPLPSPQPYGVMSQSFTGSSDAVNLAPRLPGFADSNPNLVTEDLYENIFLSKRYAEEQLPLQYLRFEPPTSQDVSPRSSRSPISKCNSQESFMLSRSSSLRYPRSCDSIGSVPELVHSKNSRDRFNVSVEQLADLAATIKAAEPSSDVSAPIRHRSSQNTAKEVPRTSVLQKASSFHSVEEEDLEENDVVLLPSVTHHERSQSAAVSQPPSFIAQRQRSASSSTTPTKVSRGSYSLFPPPSVRSAI